MSLLEVRDLSKSFGGLWALRGVSFAVEAGQIVGIMGANGAGKTTLFSLLAGHQRPNEGSIAFDGQRIDGMTPDRICRLGLVRTFQIVRPFRQLSVLDNVATAVLFGRAELTSRRAAETRAREVLVDVGLAGREAAMAGTLTLSDQKRLEVAKAVATAPRALLLDEVMAGLTPTEVKQMVTTILALKEKHELTIVIIEHVMRALMDLSERVIVLHHGEMIAAGSPRQVADHPDVLAAYLGHHGRAEPTDATTFAPGSEP